MQCSNPTFPSLSCSPASSGRSWLDRLRSSKGFPIPSHLDSLDLFLSSLSASTTQNSSSNPNPTPSRPADSSIPGRRRQAADSIPSVIADVFVIGPPTAQTTTLRDSRVSRKQPRPLITPASAENCVRAEAEEEKKKRRRKVPRKQSSTPSAISPGQSDVKKELDLKGYSRTEVTVIDSSAPAISWKSAKVIFRKGTVWKVREKKSGHVIRKRRRRPGLVSKSSSAAAPKDEASAHASAADKVEVSDGHGHPSEASHKHTRLVSDINYTTVLSLRVKSKAKKKVGSKKLSQRT